MVKGLLFRPVIGGRYLTGCRLYTTYPVPKAMSARVRPCLPLAYFIPTKTASYYRLSGVRIRCKTWISPGPGNILY